MPGEFLQVAEVPYNLVRLPHYEKDLKSLRKLEPKLHQVVREAVKKEMEGGQVDEIKGTGGWIKGRVASPSRNIGKSGGFRAIYIAFRFQHDIYLQTVYDHRAKKDLTQDEKLELKKASEDIKKAYASRGER